MAATTGPFGPFSTKAELIAERKARIGYNVALNYSDSPLLITRGDRQYLFDETGKAYLDCVNNVCHVGHCHPEVARAGSLQLATLNTNSRYLHPHIVEYARRLSATLPPPPIPAPANHGTVVSTNPSSSDDRKWVLFWVNSGSEANDLALRLARAHTGRRGVIVAEGAYHGHTVEVINISPYKYDRRGGHGTPAYVKEAALPCVYTGLYRGDIGDVAMGEAYAGEVDKLIRFFQSDEAEESLMRARLASLLAGTGAKGLGVGTSLSTCASALSLNDPQALAGCSDTVSEVGSLGSESSVPGTLPSAGVPPIVTPAVTLSPHPGLPDVGPSLTEWLHRATTPTDGCQAGLGAFIMESILSCGGQVVPPQGYLSRVYKAVRASGGVCIADEVQVGFGRVGSCFWAFQMQGEDVVPDIITLGKPMGNGLPVAAVVCTPEVAASFANGMEYFNTFGGNPVVGAVALATLHAIQTEGLQAHALSVGGTLLAGFRDLHASFPSVIGSVRGCGLMVGLEILQPARNGKDGAVADLPSTGPKRHAHPAVYSHGRTGQEDLRIPDPDAASAIKYGALTRYAMLLSTDGMADNIIKLKPPMCFSHANADEVIAALRVLIGEIAASHAAT